MHYSPHHQCTVYEACYAAYAAKTHYNTPRIEFLYTRRNASVKELCIRLRIKIRRCHVFDKDIRLFSLIQTNKQTKCLEYPLLQKMAVFSPLRRVLRDVCRLFDDGNSLSKIVA